MNASDGLNAIKLALSCFKSLFWKKKDIFYVNSNKKIANIDEMVELMPYRDWKIISVQDVIPTSKKLYASHLLRMRYQLFQIRRNMTANKQIMYSGFASPMFAACDGYFLGDVGRVSFIDYDKIEGRYYLIEFQSPSNTNERCDFPKNHTKEINVVISSSFEIASTKYNSNLTTFIFSEQQIGEVTNGYLAKVYAFVKRILVGSLRYDIDSINIFIAAKQPVSFVVGMAIQAYTPKVRLYEFIQGQYRFCLDLATLKVEETPNDIL